MTTIIELSTPVTHTIYEAPTVDSLLQRLNLLVEEKNTYRSGLDKYNYSHERGYGDYPYDELKKINALRAKCIMVMREITETRSELEWAMDLERNAR